MSKNEKEISRLSIAGLILSVLIPVILCLNFPLTSRVISGYSQIQLMDFIANCLALVLPVLALHISIAGVKDSKRQEKRGVVPGVIGIVISSLEIAAFIIVFVVYNLYTMFPVVY